MASVVGSKSGHGTFLDCVGFVKWRFFCRFLDVAPEQFTCRAGQDGRQQEQVTNQGREQQDEQEPRKTDRGHEISKHEGGHTKSADQGRVNHGLGTVFEGESNRG